MKFLVDQETTVFIRKCTLKAAEDVEKRSVTLHIALLLNPELVRSAPKFIQESFRAVRSVETGILKAELAKDIELQTIEFYPDPRFRKEAFRTQSSDLTNLTIEREQGEGADKIMLHFQVVQPLDKHLHSWVYDTLGQKVFAKFFETQGELELTSPAETTPPTKGAKAATKGGKTQ
jgi:hypothetical protein